jgi:arsenite methyltransferase
MVVRLGIESNFFDTGDGGASMSSDRMKEAIRERYAHAATQGTGYGCNVPAEQLGYDPALLARLPEELRTASLGCGTPLTFADLHPGEVVVDLGSGAGLDASLASRLVGPRGRVVGVDMTPEMVALAERNARKQGLDNVAFVQGEIESLPLPDALADVVISNCVINLSLDKPRVFREAFRILKPGGRFVVADHLATRPLPKALQQDSEAWSACISGAVTEAEYVAGLQAAGFVNIQVVRTASQEGCCGAPELPIFSAMIRAHTPTNPPR